MRSRGLKIMLALICVLFSVAASAATEKARADRPIIIYAPARDAWTPPSMLKANISYHGGPVITSAKVVLIFWGPNFANAAHADFQYAQEIIAFRNQFGTTGEYNTITQYSGIQLSNLQGSQADWFDTSTPPTNVSDTRVRNEVNAYLSGHGGNNSSTIYEVFIPRTSY